MGQEQSPGWARLARDWDRLSEIERITYTVYILRASFDLPAIRDQLNTVCGTYHGDKANLTLNECQAIRFVIERLAVLAR